MMKIEDLYSLYTEHFLVDTDTRKIRENSVFFALKGENFNGNKFAKQALENGAKYCVIDEEEYNVDDRFILVDDVLKTLQALSNYHRRQLKAPIVALTGSNGKTTTKELINAVLSKKYKTYATKGNLNNHIGVPLTLLSMTLDTEIGIVEMGANHHNEIAFLSNIAEPDFGYITNFGKAHLEGFGSVDGVIQAKSELYDFIESKSRKVFVNPNDPIQIKKTEAIDRVLFSNEISFVEANPNVSLNYAGEKVESNLIGSYNYNNIVAAITIGEYFSVNKTDIISAIKSYSSNNNRSQVITKGSNEIILDAYNANPTSMEAALSNFNNINSEKKKVVILGDMFELGNDSELEHQNIANLVDSLSLNSKFLVGSNFNQISFNGILFENFNVLSDYLKDNSIENSLILIKGSRGMALERLVDLF